jgi:mono/diheme cytochrome c family protein
VTEIPEHLLKRSRERRAAIGQGGDDAPAAGATPDATTAAAVPATTAPAATPAASAPAGPAARAGAPDAPAAPPPRIDPPYVAAAKQRRKIPFWAMATLSLMPVWGFMYVRALTDGPEVAEGPIGVGAEVYSSCANCHGGAGGGGVGYPFAGGEVLLTFPHIEDQVRYVYYGTGEYNIAGVDIYGNPDRPGGPHVTGALGAMPQQGSSVGGDLTDAEIIAVVCHERYTLGGADPTSEEYAEEYETWCAEEAPVYAALEAGEFSLTMNEVPELVNEAGEPVEITPIGDTPIPGSAG